MPTNKNAQLRYQILDRCFSDFTRKYTFNDLLDEVNEKLYDLTGQETSVRTLREDIKYMKDRMAFNAPIKAIPITGRKSYYRYNVKGYSIFKKELSTEEVAKLRSTIDMLGRYRGIPANAWLEEVISNLEYRFGVKANQENLIGFAHNEQLKGLEYLSDLIDATIQHCPLQVHYRTFKGKEFVATVHPYYIKQYNNRWFLFGLDVGERMRNLGNFALDRIVSYRRLPDKTFIPNKDIDFSHYFDDVVGVTIPREEIKKEDIVLRFTRKQFPYVVSKPIHRSQEVLDEEQCTLRISVRPTYELEQQILSYGSDVEVLSPLSFRETIRNKIFDSLQKYQ